MHKICVGNTLAGSRAWWQLGSGLIIAVPMVADLQCIAGLQCIADLQCIAGLQFIADLQCIAYFVRSYVELRTS